MSFLTINGWTVPIIVGGGSRALEAFLATSNRSRKGVLSSTDKGQKKRLAGKTPPLSEANALTLIGLLNGRGHTVSFEGGFCSLGTGLGPERDRQLATITTAQAKYGLQSAALASGGSLQYDAQLTGDYTVMVWHKVLLGSWELLTIVYDSTAASTTKYIDKASGSTINNIVMSSGVVTLQGEDTAGSGAVVWFDDLLLLPYTVSSDFVDAIVDSSVAFSVLPKLTLAGTWSNVGATATAQNVAWEVVQAEGVSTKRSVSFELVIV